MSTLDAWRRDGREVVVAGLGRSGDAAARLLHAHGIPVYATDDGATDAIRERAAALAALEGVTVAVGEHDPGRVAGALAVVPSPGIPPGAPVLRIAQGAGLAVRAEAQLGLDALAGVPAIVVTGTNGKTTTTALVDHLLRATGRRSVACGNIGTPLCAVALEPVRPEWLAVELSSFQLHDCPDVAPTVGVLTNLSPDHLDRYPTLAAYYADKARLFANARAQSTWVSNLDDPDSRTMVAPVPGRHLTFSVRHRADGWCAPGASGGAGEHLMLGGEPLLPREALQLLGRHNVANALAAALAVHVGGGERAALAEGLRTFRAIPNRLEPVREVRGVRWINDSKATNVASALVAVEAMTRPTVLLLGGRHKGEPYTALREPVAAHCRAVVAYGEAAELVMHDLAGTVPLRRVGGFDEAMAAAAALAEPGDAVLLSPACSSYDQFPNYEVRGETFRALVPAS